MIPSNFLSPTPKKSPLEKFGIDLSSNKPRSGIDISKLNLTSTPNKPVSGIDISKLNLTSAPNKPIPGIDISKLNLTSAPDKTILDKFRTRTVTPITPPLTQTNRRDIPVKHYDQATSCSPLHIILNDQLVDSETTETDEEASNLKSTLENLKNKQLQWFDRQSDEVKEGLRHKVWYNRGGKDNSYFGGDNYGEITIKANPGVLFEGSPGSSSILDLDQYLLDLNQYLLEQKQQREALEKTSSTTSSEAAQINAFITKKAVNLTSEATRISALISKGRQSEILINNFDDFIKNEVNETIVAITSKLNKASETDPEITILKEKFREFHFKAGKIVEQIRSQLDQKLAEINKAASDSDDEGMPNLDGSDTEERMHEISAERTAIENFISEGKKIQDNSEELFTMFDQLSDQTKKALAFEVWQRHDGTEYYEGKGSIVNAVPYGLKAIKNDPSTLFEGSSSIIDEYLSKLNQDSDTDEETERLQNFFELFNSKKAEKFEEINKAVSDDEKIPSEIDQPTAFFRKNWDSFVSETNKINTSVFSELHPQDLKDCHSAFIVATNQIYSNIESELNSKSKTVQENELFEKNYKEFISRTQLIIKETTSLIGIKLEAIEKAAPYTDKKTPLEMNRLAAFVKENAGKLTSAVDEIKAIISSDLNQAWNTEQKSQFLNESYNDFASKTKEIRKEIVLEKKQLKTPEAIERIQKYFIAFTSNAEKANADINLQKIQKLEEINRATSNSDIDSDEFEPFEPNFGTASESDTDETTSRRTEFATSQPPLSEEFNRRFSRGSPPQGTTISTKGIGLAHSYVLNRLNSDKEDPSLERFIAGYNNTLQITYPGMDFVFTEMSNAQQPFGDRSATFCHQAMIDAQRVITTNNLGLLVIPRTTKPLDVKIGGEKHEFLVQEKLDTTPFLNGQEQLDAGYAGSLDETIRQLAIFICKQGLSDVQLRHIPILNNNLDGAGNRKIALISVSEMKNAMLRQGAVTGLFGDQGANQTGLVHYVNKKQAQIIKTVADDNKIAAESFSDARKRKKTDLAKAELQAYYANSGITKGDEPIRVTNAPISQLNQDGSTTTSEILFFVNEQELTFPRNPSDAGKLKAYTLKLITEINEQIEKGSHHETIKERRTIIIDLQKNDQFREMDNNSARNKTLLVNALNKLVELKVIVSFTNINEGGYVIQA